MQAYELWYELIDTDDNDEHDRGTYEEMRAEADAMNADEERTGGNPDRWTVKPYGYAERYFDADAGSGGTVASSFFPVQVKA